DISESQRTWFEKKIRPLLVNRCYSCHSRQKGKAEGDLVLDSRDGWQKGGQEGPSIIPGDPDASPLIRAIRYTDSNLEMPPDKKLSAEEIRILEQWVAAGAHDPRDHSAHAALENPADPVRGRSHWAFRPLHRQVPPKTGSGWSRSPADSFILAELEKHQLQPSPAADRRTLIKRLSIVLTGIYPSRKRIVEFERDDSPDATERLVDEMLANPGWGEHWGRHWLDLARYADSNGLDENFLFREAWRYRNWVIERWNEDLPLDRFTEQQLAGDLLPFDSVQQRDRQRIGAGFLVLGPKVLLGVNGELQKMDVADELIDTVGKTFLGQTLGCARCHDHKFDPVPTRDYYALAGIFTSTEVMQQRHMLGQQRRMERLFGIGPEENRINDAYEKYWRERGKLKQQLDQARQAVAELKKKNARPKEIFEKLGKALDSRIGKMLESVPEDGENQLAQMIDFQQQRVKELNRQYTQPPPIPERAMVPVDKSSPMDEAIRLSGQFNRKGETVPRGFLQVLSRGQVPLPVGSSGRLELAHWLTDTKRGAGHLTARVMANRIWHHLFGQGLVSTPDNFGRTGQVPTHPELLDYLAQSLIDSNWSVKELVRELVQTATFQQSSQHSPAGQRIDPDNRLLWRANRRRLSPESFRDSLLATAEELDRRPLESSVGYLGDQATAVGANTNRRRTDFPNRSVYLPVIRNDLPEIFEAFDFTDAHRTTGARPHTTMATTGLFLLNDGLMQKTSEALARRVLAEAGPTDPEIATEILKRILLAEPDQREVNRMVAYVRAVQSAPVGPPTPMPPPGEKPAKPENAQQEPGRDKSDVPPEPGQPPPVSRLRAWSSACHALMASSRFQIVE
ncbi:MAG: DUF1553 domain-containing protein, partial [Planctomycetota bacterium]|nr:DUF1553 domain-containing protein [Planctomycetota bacterium]